MLKMFSLNKISLVDFAERIESVIVRMIDTTFVHSTFRNNMPHSSYSQSIIIYANTFMIDNRTLSIRIAFPF